MVSTIKKRKISKKYTKKNQSAGASLSSLRNIFKSTPEKPGALKAVKNVPKKQSFLSKLFGREDIDVKAKKEKEALSRDEKTAKKQAISKKEETKKQEQAIKEKTKEKVEAQKEQLTQAAKSKVSDLFKDAEFKTKLEDITARKVESFGKKPDQAKVRDLVSSKIDELKAKQREKAEADAKAARDAELAKANLAASQKKGFLASKLDQAKASLKERLDSLTDSTKREKLKEQKAREDAETARKKANEAKEKAKDFREKAELKEKKAKEANENANKETNPSERDRLKEEAKKADEDAKKAREDAATAKEEANKLRRNAFEKENLARKANEKTNNLKDPAKRDQLRDDARKADEDAGKARNDAGRAKEEYNNLKKDVKVKERKAQEARERANNEKDPNVKKSLDEEAKAREAEARKAREDVEKARRVHERLENDAKAKERKANQAKERAEKIDNPKDRMNTKERDKFEERKAREDARKARDNADQHYKAREGFRSKLRGWLGKIFNLLMTIFHIILPYLRFIGITGIPRTERTLNPTSIVFPITEAPPPPPPPPPTRKEGEEEKEEEKEDEEEYGIMFSLQTQPDEDITFNLESLSDYLTFDQSTITFPVESWDTPVYVSYSCILDTTVDEDTTYTKVKAAKPTKKAVKVKSINITSEPTIEELVAERDYLYDKMKPRTFKQILEDIQRQAELEELSKQVGGDYAEPIYDDDLYKPYEEPVVPSIRTKIIHDEDDFTKYIEPIVDPTYDDGYESYHETVIPTFDGGQEENYESEELLDKLDYATLSQEIDNTQLSDNFKAEFQLTLYNDIDYEIDLNIQVSDSNIWVVEPYTLSFSSDDAQQNTYMFSNEIYQFLKDSYAQEKGQVIADQYLNSAQEDYDAGIEQIDNELEEAKQNANKAYNSAYEKSLNEDQNNINDAQNLLNTLDEAQTGGKQTIYYLNKFKNRTHRLK